MAAELIMPGRLFYLMGPSGAGKDSLIRRARERIGGAEPVLFAHRYITRPPELAGENHIHLSEREFNQRLRAGLFALCWHSHGLRYGIGRELDLWLAAGFNVVVNGSRGHLAQARARYPELVPVAITVPPATLRARLLSRGRETEEEIDERLTRTGLEEIGDCPGLLTLANDGPLDTAADRLIDLVVGDASTSHIRL